MNFIQDLSEKNVHDKNMKITKIILLSGGTVLSRHGERVFHELDLTPVFMEYLVKNACFS